MSRKPARPPRSPPRRSWLRRIVRWFLLLVLLFVAGSALLVLSLRWLDPPTSGIQIVRAIEASAGRKADYRAWSCWRDLDQLGPTLPMAVIAAEDQRFAEHYGFDVAGIKRALQESKTGGPVAGRQHAEPADRQEPVPVARAQLGAQGPGSLVHRVDRTELAQTTHPRGLSEHRRIW